MAFSYEQNLVSRWDMSTINPVDLGFRGLGNNGVGTGLVAATDIVQGRTSMATEFDGTEYVRHAEANWRSTDTQGTIALWFKLGGLGASRALFASCDEATANFTWMFYANAANRIASYAYESGAVISQLQGDTVLTQGRWYHGVIVSDGTITSFYVDGIRQVVGILGGTNAGQWLNTVTNRDNFTIGGALRNAFAFPWLGVIDDVRYYSQPLTNIDVADLYARSRRGATGG